MFPNIGELNYSIDIQKPVNTRTDLGEETTTWETVSSVNAHKRAIRGNESMMSDQRQASRIVEWWMHLQEEINETYRIVECRSGLIYGINYTEPHYQKRWLKIEATALPQRDQDNLIGVGR